MGTKGLLWEQKTKKILSVHSFVTLIPLSLDSETGWVAWTHRYLLLEIIYTSTLGPAESLKPYRGMTVDSKSSDFHLASQAASQPASLNIVKLVDELNCLH